MNKEQIRQNFEVTMHENYLNVDLKYNIDLDCYYDLDIDRDYQMFKAGYNCCIIDCNTQKDGE